MIQHVYTTFDVNVNTDACFSTFEAGFPMKTMCFYFLLTVTYRHVPTTTISTVFLCILIM